MKLSTSLVWFGCLSVLFLACLLPLVIRGENDLILSDQATEESVVSSVSEATDADDTTISNEKFIPTHEWQVIKKKQAIPAGLHVRMNFQTGIREAKLLDDDDDKNSKKLDSDGGKVRQESADAGENPRQSEKHDDTADKNVGGGPKIILADDILRSGVGDGEFTNEKLVFSKSHLKQVLQDFKDKVGTKDVQHVTWSDDAKDALKKTLSQEENVEINKKKFRSIDDIKADLDASMGWNVKSDAEIMREITLLLTSSDATRQQQIAALDHLEEYAHQIDNGKDLEKIGSLKFIVGLLNNSDEVLQEKAANVIGAAAQSNKEVQEAILNHGGLKFLIRMLDMSKQMLTQKKGLYAVSAVIRGDHHVQLEFVKLGGLKAILQIIKHSTVNSLRVKAVTLLYDLIVEQDEVMQRMIQAGKKKPSDRSPLLNALTEGGWCEELLPLLQTKDYDAKEKVIQALVVSVRSCAGTLKKHLGDMKQELHDLIENINNEDDEDFKSYLLSLKEQLDKNVIQQLQILSS